MSALWRDVMNNNKKEELGSISLDDLSGVYTPATPTTKESFSTSFQRGLNEVKTELKNGWNQYMAYNKELLSYTKEDIKNMERGFKTLGELTEKSVVLLKDGRFKEFRGKAAHKISEWVKQTAVDRPRTMIDRIKNLTNTLSGKNSSKKETKMSSEMLKKMTNNSRQ